MDEQNNTFEAYCIKLKDAFVSAYNQIVKLIISDVEWLYSMIFDRR